MVSKKIRLAILGATGYTGREAISILLNHPDVEIVHLYSLENIGDDVTDVFLQFLGRTSLKIEETDVDAVIRDCNCAMLCVPHTAAMGLVAELHAGGVRVIDFSADYRLNDVDEYNATYGVKHKHAALFKEAVYGLPELHREEIRSSRLVANPGCYPTGAILAGAPLVKKGLVRTESIIVDAKSGVSGAGRALNVNNLFAECNESISAYKIGTHRHQPEMTQELSLLAGEKVPVLFVPHLIPVTRGILSTVYFDLVEEKSVEELHGLFEEFYEDDYFVHVLPLGTMPKTGDVAMTNFCHIAVTVTPTGELVVVTAIDNLIKGASGQAVQNMNIMFGLTEEKGFS
jgi:N-acetyl-gamma-glutamyl-phosphate reductase